MASDDVPAAERRIDPTRARRPLGGAKGNAALTSLSAAILVVLLAVEGATIPTIHSLLSVHIFVGILLLGPLALKLLSAGYRFVRYCTGTGEYVRLGPPAPLMRFLVSRVVVSPLILFGTASPSSPSQSADSCSGSTRPASSSGSAP